MKVYKVPIFNLADQRISDDLRRIIPPWSPGNDNPTPKPNPKCTVWRYPRIDSIRIISKVNTPSATVKIRRRVSLTGGPAVIRTYNVYSKRWLARWHACQMSLFKEQRK